MLEKNETLNDRITRLLLGIVFILTMIYFVTLNTIGAIEIGLALIFAVLAIIMLVTGIIGMCPIYSALGINHNKA